MGKMKINRKYFVGILLVWMLLSSCENKTALETVRALKCNSSQSFSCTISRSHIVKFREVSQMDIGTIEKEFYSDVVRVYEKAVMNNPFPSAVIGEPKEVTNIIKVGKPILPILFDNLDKNDDFMNLASLRVISEITGQSFSYDEAYKDLRYNKSIKREKWQLIKKKYLDWWAINKDRERNLWLMESIANDDRRIIIAMNELAQLNDKRAIPIIKDVYKKTKDDLVLERAARALAKLGDGYSIPYIIENYLINDTEQIRCEGIVLLQNLTSETLCYDPKSPEFVRNQNIKLWKEWWNNNRNIYKSDFVFQ